MLGYIVIFGPIVLAMLFHLVTKRWLNPYKLIAADSVDIAVLRFSRFYPDCGILCVFAPVMMIISGCCISTILRMM